MKTTFERYKFLLSVILMAAILSACDPMCFKIQNVSRVVIFENKPYLKVSDLQSVGPCLPIPENERSFLSNDGGVTWLEAESLPFEMPRAIEEPENRPILACVSADKNICFRIAGKEQVEMSLDGGKTWQIDWQTPIGRKKYPEKNPIFLPMAGIHPDTIPFDIGIGEKDGKYLVVVAMGNQGVLVKPQDGKWERYAVPSGAGFPESAAPLPYYAASINEAFQSLQLELEWIFSVTVLFFVSILLSGWFHFNLSIEKKGDYKKRIAFIPYAFAACCTIFVLSVIMRLLSSEISGEIFHFLNFFIERIPIGFMCLSPVVGLIFTWLFVVMLTKNRKYGVSILVTLIGYSVMFYGGTLIPFIMWAFGLIPIYEIALALSIILGGVIAYYGFRKEKQLAISAMQPKGVAKEGDL